ncbi:MAG: hypothetical protein HY753_04765 [Nitrospirae bacterium]|nr:hypothetical protein [Nitrospirota bacterium]MBI4838413.1 hypothetical protein [Nitrospirota bacterium]
MEAITEKTTKILGLLIPEGNLDYKVRKILKEDLKRKLTEFQLIDNRFQKKYGMSFDEFEKRNIIKEKNFSFEVESDYHEWDAAIDAIKALKDKTKDLSNE